MLKFISISAILFMLFANPVSFASQIGIWTSTKEVADIPTDNCAWKCVKKAADEAIPNTATVSDQDGNNNVQTLAAAIVYIKTGDKKYKDKVVTALEKLVSAGKPGDSTLAWGRETAAYVMAADLVGYRTSAFENWALNIAEVWVASDGRTMLEMFRNRPNNWGSHGFASLCAIYAYLNNHTKLEEVRNHWVRNVVGPKPDETQFGDLSWHADKNNPRVINPKGAQKEGVDIDGIIPDDMRRGAAFKIPPVHTGYAWEYLQGIVVAARILERMDMPIWEIGDKAIYRAAYALQVRLDKLYGGWKAGKDDEWMLPFLDKAYGTDWSNTYDPCSSRLYKHGKNAGWGWILLKQ